MKAISPSANMENGDITADKISNAGHVCEICGVNQSSRGKLFASAADVWQHKRKRHPEACEDKLLTSPRINGSNGTNGRAPAARKRQKKIVSPNTSAHNNHQIQFCPCCGFNLQVVHAAMEFVNGSIQ